MSSNISTRKHEIIKREKTIAYNLQYNEVDERKNRSINSLIKSMIDEQSLIMFLWEEECNISMCLYNRSPHKILEEKAPDEALKGVGPKVGHLSILVVQCTSMFLWKRGKSWSPQVRREF